MTNKFDVKLTSKTVTTTTPAPAATYTDNSDTPSQSVFETFGNTTAPPSPVIEQQRFLGASIVSFSSNLGLGDTTSQLSVRLVEDPGDANNGIAADNFDPPDLGEPVWFCFGHIQLDETDGGFKRAIDDLYGNTAGTNADAGDYHFAFGGLLQSWTYNEDASSGRVYNVNVVDPREVLQGVHLILNGHAGTTHGSTNVLNIYGFLEHIPWNSAKRSSFVTSANLQGSFTVGNQSLDVDQSGRSGYTHGEIITGIGMSLRTEHGMPLFRIAQALNSMTGNHQYTILDNNATEYDQYGGQIKFRGNTYMVDLAGVPIPDHYYKFSYDSISLFDFIQECCDASNHELYVALLPPLANNEMAFQRNQSEYAGVIKIISVDRTDSSGSGASSFATGTGNWLTAKEIGTELDNRVTGKFVTGAKEVLMYHFSGEHDEWLRHGGHQLGVSLKNQIIPYYGTLGNKIATIPRGAGPWSQIILDSRGCGAAGVGDFYVTTEIELRAVDISFDKWVEFLQSYNKLLVEKVSAGGAIIDDDAGGTANNEADGSGNITGGTAEITVPRCVWVPSTSDKTKWDNGTQWCSPPYGFPLYYERAKKIGLYTGGALGMSAKSPKIADDASGSNVNMFKKNAARVNNSDGTSVFPQATIKNQEALETAITAAFAKEGLNNAKVIYNFLKAVADECLGKKFLVKIPQKPNLGWNASGGYGFPKRNIDGSIAGDTGSWSKSEKETMLTLVGAATFREKGALDIGYDYGEGKYEFNYYPEPQGGLDHADIDLTPDALEGFFASGGRVPAFCKMRGSPGDLNLADITKGDYVIYNGALFVKAELEPDYYCAPKLTTLPTVAVYGDYNQTPTNVVTDDEEELDPYHGTKKVISPVKSQEYTALYSTSNNISDYFTIDLDNASSAPNFFDGFHVYVLITIPRVSLTEDVLKAAGLANGVNLANITHYLREDVVVGMPGMSTVPNLPTIQKTGGAGTTEEKAVEGLTFSLNRRINMTSPGPVYPLIAAIPLRNTERSYGPWYDGDFENGKVEHIHEESLAPWNYGGYSNMDTAGNILAAGTAGTDLTSERATFTMAGWPSGITPGTRLSGGPFMTNIQTEFSTQMIKTTVTMDSYTPSFGKMQKQKLDRIKSISRQQMAFRDSVNAMIRKNIINAKSNGGYTGFLQNVFKSAMQGYGHNYSTPLQRGEKSQNNSFTLDYNVSTGCDGSSKYDPNNMLGEYSEYFYKNQNTAMQSAADTAEMTALLANHRTQYYAQYWRSISTTIDEMFHPASFTCHDIFPNIKQPTDLLLYIDDLDDDQNLSYYD